MGAIDIREPSDVSLVTAMLEDGTDAFGTLFEQHADAVYNHCFRRTGDWSLAEDLTSVVFLQAWRNRRRIQLVEGSALPWLLAVANNMLRNTTRSVRRHRRLIAKLRPEEAAPDFADEAAERMDDVRTVQRLNETFQKLAVDDQEVISLCVWAGLSYVEAAAALDVPVGTVKSRLARARGRLRRLMETPEPAVLEE
ncbi:RNA polymerase sigma factor [Actinomadura macrotermitis]|uniref:ECF RNA polymerase sigma factor SigE n=1 Tax=Actinomadura macrotermitis TaxID=2585200 RepID=A0A7K0BRD5_9ACTN|nr:RNA polymerase sigma factor [Actinomadura macrotermitis]MQY03750.1 ECF RNA polymerase sigma factor SigE [Actinomadura macrotermitis]